MRTRVAVALLAVSAALSAPAQEKLRARELFLKPPAPAPSAAKKKQTAAKKSTGVPSRQAAEDAGGTAESVIVPASAVPLGLRYSLLKAFGDEFREVDPDTTFYSKDRIRVTVEANDTGYLYIVMRGSSGNWRLLFPSPEINGGQNQVVRGRRHQIPSQRAFVFDEQSGTEKLFLVLTRQPEQDLERLIYSLSSKPAEEPKRLMMADHRSPISDDLINRVRGKVMARDLVFEKVDETSSGDRKETAIYVVNPTLSADSRLVVDLDLKHR